MNKDRFMRSDLRRSGLPADPLAASVHHAGGMGADQLASWQPHEIQAADGQAADTRNDITRRGLRLAREGRPREAVRYLKEALSADAAHGVAWNNLGVLYQQNGALGPAMDCYGRAVKAADNLTVAWLNLGWGLLLKERAGEARSYLQEVVTREAENRAAWDGLAEAHRQAGNMEEAVLCWRRAGRQGMDRRTAWVRSADVLLDGEDPAGAISCLRRALLDGEEAGIWARLAYAHSLLGQDAPAVRGYSRALELEPQRPGVHYNLATVLLGQGRLREARRHLEAAVRQEPEDAQAWSNLGHVAGELGAVERARECFERALEIDPACHEAWNNLAGWHEQQGDRRAAAEGYSRALDLVPENSSYLLNRALVLAGMKQPEEARKDLDELCRRQPELAEMLRDLPAFRSLAPLSPQGGEGK